MTNRDQPEILGITGILPLDHVFLLPPSGTFSGAEAEAQGLEVSSTIPNVSFYYESYRRSGGGRIANILAYLGRHGHHVAACGAVGDDPAGEAVLNDLEHHSVNIDSVRHMPGRRTRVVYILTKAGSSKSRQVHPRTTGLARFHPSLLHGLPPAQILLLGRGNRGVIDLARDFREKHNSVVSFHIGDCPWRVAELAALHDTLELSDIVVMSQLAAGKLAGCPGLPPEEAVAELDLRSDAKLIVVYDGINRVAARHQGGAIFVAKDSQYVAVTDPTGMMDCFHAALLSFLLRGSWRIDDADVVKSAIQFANEIAAFNGTGIGARHFPLVGQHEYFRSKYWDKISTRHACFISHSSHDAQFVQQLTRRLESEPGVKAWVNAAVPGHQVSEAIRSALECSNVFVLALSQWALKSEWVQREVELANDLAAKGRLRIVLVDDFGESRPSYGTRSAASSSTRCSAPTDA